MWTKVADRKPPEAIILDTTNDNGKTKQKLMYRFGMWWTSDGKYQVIQAPLAWKLTTDWG